MVIDECNLNIGGLLHRGRNENYALMSNFWKYWHRLDDNSYNIPRRSYSKAICGMHCHMH